MPTGGKPRKRAQRVQLSCIPCREAKLKCDKQLPCCHQCYKRSKDASCVYTERGLRYNTARTGGMREKIDRLEFFVNRLKEAGPSSIGIPLENENTNQNEGTSIQSNDSSSNTGNLRLSNTGSTQYIGPTHWESIIEDIAEVKAYFEIENSPGSIADDSAMLDTSSVSPVDIQLGISPTYVKHDLRALLPSKSDMDRAVTTWFQSADTMRLILHAPKFQDTYRDFWKDQESVSLAWLAALLSIVSIGMETLGQLGNDTNVLSQAERFRRLSAHALVLADYTCPQPYIVEALLLHVKSLMIKGHECDGRIWMLCGAVTRLCIRAGYHRDPSKNPAISSLDGEMRRRVWACACEYDIMVAYQSGSVSVINQQRQDTLSPGNFLDNDLVADVLPPPRSLEDPTPMAFAIVHGKLVSIYGDIIYSSNSLNSPSQSEISHLQERLEQARDEMPRNFKMTPIDECIMDSPELILNRYKLELLYRKACCILYRRYLGSREHEQNHMQCLDSAEQLVRIQVELLETCKPGGQLAAYLVLVQRHVHDLVVAVMLLCAQWKDEISSVADNDRRQRTIPLVLQACTLWRDIGVPSNKPKNALRAVELFVERLTNGNTPNGKSENAPAHDVAAGGRNRKYHGNEEHVVGQAPTNLLDINNQDFSYSETTAFTTLHYGGLDFDQDVMFRDIFGPTQSFQEARLGSQWI